jgi:hypothetical protein
VHLSLCRAVNEVVVARQLKHAAYRTARVARRHRWLLSHTQAPPWRWNKPRRLAASQWPVRSGALGPWEAARAYPRCEAIYAAHVLLARCRRAVPARTALERVRGALRTASLLLHHRSLRWRVFVHGLRWISRLTCGRQRSGRVRKHKQKAKRERRYFCGAHTRRWNAHLQLLQPAVGAAAGHLFRRSCALRKKYSSVQGAARCASSTGQMLNASTTPTELSRRACTASDLRPRPKRPTPIT